MNSVEARTYRATVEAWLGQLLLPLTFFIILTITAVNLSGLNPWIGAIGLAVLITVVGLDYIQPMIRNWILIDDRTLEGSLNGRYFHVYWTEVLAAWVVERRRQRYLCIGTRNGTAVLSMRFFDDQSIWNKVKGLVPPAALEEKAIQRLPDYKEWAAARDLALEEAGGSSELAEPRPVADHWLVQIIGWAGLAFFLFGGMSAMTSGAYAPAIPLLVLAAVCTLALVNWGLTEINCDKVERYTLFGHARINWEDVRWIEVDPFDSVLVLVGEENCLVVPGPKVWAGSGKSAALAMLLTQIERRRIPVRHTLLALLRFSKHSGAKK